MIDESISNDDGSNISEAEALEITKKPAKGGRGRAWVLTVGLEHMTREQVIEACSSYTAARGQLERGETTGYVHWQLYIENDNAVHFTALKKAFPKAHIEQRRATRAIAVAYCTKKATRVEGVESISIGELDLDVIAGQRNDLVELRQALLDGERYEELIMRDHRALRYASSLQQLQLVVDQMRWCDVDREVEGHYIWGTTDTGKTRFVMDTYGRRNVHKVSDYARSGHAFDSYRVQPVVLLDEYRSSYKIPFLLQLMDRYPLELSARYANKWAAFTRVFLTSNIPFEEQHLSSDELTIAALKRRLLTISEMKECADSATGFKPQITWVNPKFVDRFTVGEWLEVD